MEYEITDQPGDNPSPLFQNWDKPGQPVKCAPSGVKSLADCAVHIPEQEQG